MNYIFHKIPKRKLKVRVKGVVNKVKGILSPIQFYVRVPDGNWKPYLRSFEPQRYGAWDTNCCWLLSCINSAEAQLNYLWDNNEFSDDAKNFFLTNGYRDSTGFNLSEQFHEKLCGNIDNGGTAEEAWQSFQKRGHIPRSMLAYSLDRANQFTTKENFNTDYFNPDAVTPEMKLLGLQFLSYVNISYQRIGKIFYSPDISVLIPCMKQSPPNIGVSVPAIVSNWNDSVVEWDGGKVMAHEVTMYNLESDGKRDILDQYNPYEKVLSADYPLLSVVQGIVEASKPISIPNIPQNGQYNSFWTAVNNWWNNIFNPLPVGKE